MPPEGGATRHDKGGEGLWGLCCWRLTALAHRTTP